MVVKANEYMWYINTGMKIERHHNPIVVLGWLMRKADRINTLDERNVIPTE
jgi:hypothetical protein